MTRRTAPGLTILAIVLVALNLRGSIAAVPPVLDVLRVELALDATRAGLLTTLPVLLFALAAPPAAWLGRRLGPGRAILLGLVLIVLGTVGRVLGGSAALLLGTVVLGVGMTVGNVLVPVVAKRDFGHRAPLAIGCFTASLAVGATLTAGLAVPAEALLGWRAGLGIWVVLALLAIPVWFTAVVRREPRPGPAAPGDGARDRGASARVWRHPLAWAVALALGSQSALYYSLTTWMPTYLVQEAGLSPGVAGGALSLFQVTAIPATLAVPFLCRLRRTQGWIGACVVAGWVVIVVGLYAAPQLWPLWTVVGGLSQGGGFALALTLVVLRSQDQHVTRPLSGMGQLVGYSIGAAGPFAVGVLADATGSWVAPGVLLLALAGVQLVATEVAGRDRTIH